MKNTLPNGTTTLVGRWNKHDHYTLIKTNGETVITGSGTAGLKRAFEHLEKNPELYIFLRWEGLTPKQTIMTNYRATKV